MLEIRDLHVAYGGIQAVKGISIDVPTGQIVTLIGANGAGKSSTLRAIAGLCKNRRGTISWNGKELSPSDPVAIVKAGIVMSPEGRRIFPHLSVLENLQLGAYSRNDKDGIASDMTWVFDLFPRLSERRRQHGGTLSGGEQQMLAIARAFMSRPKVLLLDEPSLGLSPMISQHIFRIIKNVNEERGMTILLVEQNANMALKLADRAYVLETGTVVMEDTAERMRENTDIKKAYLGQ